MTDPVTQTNDTIFQAVWDTLYATDLFGARIWMTGQVPTKTPTYPFMSIQPLGNVTVVWSGDGAQMMSLQQQVQIDLWQESATHQDVSLPGQLVRALRAVQSDVMGSRAQTRFMSMFLIPTPEDETALHHSITIIVHHMLESL